mmetsp:Transcript_140952/g.450716  ORF Transcript_140952/g.450716 Transcript_140952/m.450716 type:complete len:218 (+) Transcript_140952:58-711(+)
MWRCWFVPCCGPNRVAMLRPPWVFDVGSARRVCTEASQDRGGRSSCAGGRGAARRTSRRPSARTSPRALGSGSRSSERPRRWWPGPRSPPSSSLRTTWLHDRASRSSSASRRNLWACCSCLPSRSRYLVSSSAPSLERCCSPTRTSTPWVAESTPSASLPSECFTGRWNSSTYLSVAFCSRGCSTGSGPSASTASLRRPPCTRPRAGRCTRCRGVSW